MTISGLFEKTGDATIGIPRDVFPKRKILLENLVELLFHHQANHLAIEVLVSHNHSVRRKVRQQPFSGQRRDCLCHKAVVLCYRITVNELAGNDEILLTAIAPRELVLHPAAGGIVLSAEILTNPATKRIAVRVPVRTLHVILTDLPARGASVEHLYDY